MAERYATLTKALVSTWEDLQDQRIVREREREREGGREGGRREGGGEGGGKGETFP